MGNEMLTSALPTELQRTRQRTPAGLEPATSPLAVDNAFPSALERRRRKNGFSALPTELRCPFILLLGRTRIERNFFASFLFCQFNIAIELVITDITGAPGTKARGQTAETGFH